eukprot:GHUV01008611.1.p2 GENE.GHUV01008611.1~~GHUV01008611.1.p2  ORF type:complete len:239 (+),score=93.91 GHUV01008611.1:168-884(+)
MSDRGCTESKERLLAQYELLRDIKEGRRKPTGGVRVQQQPQTAAEPASTAAAAVGQKQPSRLRFKAVTKPTASAEQPSSPLAPRSPQGQAPAPAAGGAGFAAPTAEAAALPAEQPVRATISRDELAALLAKKKQEQQQAAAEGTAQPTPQPSGAGTGAASTAAAQASVAAAHRPQQKPRPQPKVLKLPPTAPAPVMAQQQSQAGSRPTAAADEVDYDAVSSPEYDVDYDAVSSPEYDA